MYLRVVCAVIGGCGEHRDVATCVPVPPSDLEKSIILRALFRTAQHGSIHPEGNDSLKQFLKKRVCSMIRTLSAMPTRTTLAMHWQGP